MKTIVLLLGLWACSACHAAEYFSARYLVDIDYPSLKPDQRIVGFKIDLKGAKFDSIDPLPAGWSLKIENGSDGVASLEGEIDVGMAEVMGESGHLCLVSIADEQRCTAREKRHRQDHAVLRDLVQRLPDIACAAHGARRDDRAGCAEFRSVRRECEPDEKRRVEAGVEQDAVVGPQQQKQRTAW